MDFQSEGGEASGFTCLSTSQNNMRTIPHLTSPHLISLYITSPHLTSPHLTSLHLTLPYLI
ncbi:hypothetical protein E2C01_097710 [Portunus trituberculatus]|uniref:Uncharacterized protein n=1 Tax=Portunus trituberculatus TaxID=210409 RepID=A0A5B7K553_PORTR|nr:hypothetical protein [Portunus trituberculatus]